MGRPRKNATIPEPFSNVFDEVVEDIAETAETKKGKGNRGGNRQLRTKKLGVCMTPETFEVIEQRAHRNGMATSTYVNFLLMKFAGTFDDKGLFEDK